MFYDNSCRLDLNVFLGVTRSLRVTLFGLNNSLRSCLICFEKFRLLHLHLKILTIGVHYECSSGFRERSEKCCERKCISGDLELSDVRKTGCYIFNSSEDGFVIVSSDDKITPIGGYSKTGSVRMMNESSSSSSSFGWLNSVDECVDSLVLFR